MVINGKPTVISLFAGTGGSSLGYQWAGYHELLAIDFDKHAVECFKLNFPNVPIWQRSVAEVTGAEILTFCKIKKGDLDVLDGSPPCQGFSTAGKRKVKDPRNDLFEHYVRLINELQPKVFVMENVPGMARGVMKGKFITIMNALKSTGYNVSAKQMNAANYGVPQSRERIIFIGSKEGTPRFPNPTKLPKKTIKELFPSVTSHSRGQFDRKKKSPYSVAYTVTKTATMKFFENEIERSPTIEECKIMCSFPIDWKMSGKYSLQWARLGNAVMPKFMQAIAETIKKEMLYKNPQMSERINGM